MSVMVISCALDFKHFELLFMEDATAMVNSLHHRNKCSFIFLV